MSQKALVCILSMAESEEWKLLRRSDKDSFLSGSTNISDDDNVSDTLVSAEFEVAPVSFCA